MKCFVNQSELNKHKTVHTAERPCKCLTCGKGFKNGEQLTAHKLTDDKLHLCAVCGKHFLKRSTLLIHERRHVGDKPSSKHK